MQHGLGDRCRLRSDGVPETEGPQDQPAQRDVQRLSRDLLERESQDHVVACA
jgi:hypothetical protein